MIENLKHHLKEIMRKWFGALVYRINFVNLFYLRDNFNDLCQPHITYQKANNMVVKFIEEEAGNIELLITALRNFLRTIQYVYSLFFPKIYNE